MNSALPPFLERKVVPNALIVQGSAERSYNILVLLFTLLVIPPATATQHDIHLLFFLNTHTHIHTHTHTHTHTTGVRKERLQTLLDCCCFQIVFTFTFAPYPYACWNDKMTFL